MSTCQVTALDLRDLSLVDWGGSGGRMGAGLGVIGVGGGSAEYMEMIGLMISRQA